MHLGRNGFTEEEGLRVQQQSIEKHLPFHFSTVSMADLPIMLEQIDKLIWLIAWGVVLGVGVGKLPEEGGLVHVLVDACEVRHGGFLILAFGSWCHCLGAALAIQGGVLATSSTYLTK